KIADFGLATKLSRPDEIHKTMCGTPNYMSPEILLSSPHGREVDVWGLGCMLYTLLVGHPPFDSKAIKSTFDRVVNLDYQMPQHISSDGQDLIRRMLKKKPTDRITLEEILCHPFMRKPQMMATYKSQ
ncbi:serine/threonine-protein kinase PLK4-like, partial [Homalodisca vitripennis]|uniref:serine/threonine-protein kinase PLK4-like n=1 Tax=Homalodisca vitripennis TaxID=197043 RepID=UPI001EEC5363